MKISSDHVGRILGAELRAKQAARAAGSSPANGPDRVNLSRRAADLQVAQRALEAAPEGREQEVAVLRLQVERGEYHVDDQDLAADLLRESARQRAR